MKEKEFVFGIVAILVISAFLPIVNADGYSSLQSEGSKTKDIVLYLHDETADVNTLTGIEIMNESGPNNDVAAFHTSLLLGLSQLISVADWYMDPPAKDDMQIKGNVTTALWLGASVSVLATGIVILSDVAPDGTETEIGNASRVISLDALIPQEYTFTISNINYTLPVAHTLKMEFLAVGIQVEMTVFYDSADRNSRVLVPIIPPIQGNISMVVNPSIISLNKGETKDVTITIINNIDSSDNVTLTGSWEGDTSNGCNAEFDPTKLSLAANGMATSTLTISAPADAEEGNIKYNIVAVSDLGGNATKQLQIEVKSGPAAEYGVRVTAPEGKKGEAGEEITYTFKIKNLGNVDDIFTLEATSEDNWNVTAPGSTQIPANGEKDIDVKVKIPSDAEDGITDSLTIKATPQGDPSKFHSASVTTTVGKTVSLVDQLNNFANSIIGPIVDSLGLREILGDYAPLILLAAIIVLLLLILLLMILAARNVPFKMECADNERDAKRGMEMQYQITLTTKKGGKKGIPVLLEAIGVPDGWNANLDQTKVFAKRKEQQTVFLTVTPPADALDGTVAKISVIGHLAKVKKEEWKPAKKKRKITTRTKATVPVPRVEITNVANIPQEAKKGDRVLTIIEIENHDDVEVQGVKCSLYVNDLTVHSEIVSIPASSKVEIKKSWIADSDDNEVRVALE